MLSQATLTPMKKPNPQPKPVSFEQRYPQIAHWVMGGGWIEIGREDGFSHSFVRALDEGGMVYEGEASYATMDDALQALETGIGAWLEENG